MKKRFKQGFLKTPAGFLLFGLLFSFLVLFALSLIFGGILSATDNPTKSVGTASMISFLLSGAITGLVISKVKGEGGFVYSSITGLIFILCVLIISFISCDGKISLAALMNVFCYLLITLLFSFMGRKRTHKRKRHRKFAA